MRIGAYIIAIEKVADSLEVPVAMPTLSYTVDRMEVRYDRGARGSLDRTVSLTLNTRTTAPDGQISFAERCERSTTDRVWRHDLPRIESTTLPGLAAPLPPATFRRRVLEPVLLAGATAVTVVLFFTLRSKRTTSE
jgi:hypothetical protein